MLEFRSPLLAHAVRFFAASQMLPIAVIQLGWILLIATVGSETGALGDGFRPLGRALTWSYTALGGVGPDGRGDETHLMVVWGKLTLAFYLLGLLWRALTRRRETRWSFRRRLAVSTAVAAIGWGVMLAIAPQAEPDVGGSIFVWVVMTIGAFVATAWALAWLRLADLLERTPSAPTQRAVERTAPN